MNVTPENIIVNSCEYTPVYLIQTPGVTQAGSYYVAQSSQDEQKPVTDNLKRFYENSGNLENCLLSCSNTKPRILKKQNNVVGNNLKLASFLLPKTENLQNSVQNMSTISNVQNVQNIQKPVPIPALSIPVNNVVVKPSVTATSENGIGPRVEIDRKIVRVGTIPYTSRNQFRTLPKMKPKEKVDPNPSKLTSVQLLKLGETYHSLNQLSEDQMKIVSKALKIFGNPEQAPLEPAYDPVTNTKFIYKIVSPRDLTVVGKNGVILKNKQEIYKQSDVKKMPEIKKQPEIKIQPEVKKKPEVKKHTEVKKKPEIKKSPDVNQRQSEVRKQLEVKKHPEVKKSPLLKKLEEIAESVDELEPEVPAEPKVTRSGRTVKLKRPMTPRESPQKPKKRASSSVVNCFQCSAEFCSFYRLQRHYESYPTHIPARIHTNLFHCLVAIINGGSEEDQANIFIQQLEHLIEKLKSLLPCLLKKIDGCDGTQCSVNDDIGRLFDMNPGKYSLNMNALNCMKDKDGYCIHSPAPKTQFHIDINKSLQPNNKDDVASESESEDCARINSVDKWPRLSKRLWKLKQQKSQNINAKRMKLISESDQFIELGVEDVGIRNNPDESAINLNKAVIRTDLNISLSENANKHNADEQEIVGIPTSIDQSKKPKPQFRSTHFDIRSSPIKLPSALVRKFQLDPQKTTKMKSFEVQILRPSTLGTDNNGSQDSIHQEPVQTFEVTLGDNDLQGDTAINDEITFQNPERWDISEPNHAAHHNLLFKSNLTHEKDELGSPLNSSIAKEESCLFEPSSKPNILVSTMIHNDKTNNSIKPSLIHVKDKSNCIFDTSESNLLDIKDHPSGYFEPSAIHVKTSSDSLIDPSMILVNDKSFEAALSNVRERSHNLFEPVILHTKSNSLIESKTNSIFDSTLPHVKERSSSLYNSGLMHTKDKDSLIGPSLIHVKENNVYDSIAQRKENLIKHMSHDKSNVSIDSTLMDVKDELQSQVDIGENDLNAADPRLLSSEGQSVLNFLESLGNEPLGLTYPETDIRNNSVDFQLDLFSFSNS